MPTVTEMGKDLEQKRGDLTAFWEKFPRKDGQPDMSVADVEEFNRRHDEVNEVAKQFEAAREAERKAAENAKGLEDLRRIDHRVPFDGDQDGGRKDAFPLGLGDLFCESKTYQAKTKGVPETMKIDLKTVFARTGTGGWAVEAIRNRPYVLAPLQTLNILDVIPVRPVNSSAVRYMLEDAVTNSAASTAESIEGTVATYPEQALHLTETTSPVEKVAVFLPISDEQLEDVEYARSYINDRLSTLIRSKLEAQILIGSGTTPQLRGILNLTGINAQAKGADPATDALYKAMILTMVNGFANPNLIIMHPTDYQNIRLLRTADGIYIFGNPSDAGPRQIWGLPVTLNTLLTVTNALVVDTEYLEIGMRRDVDVQISNSHSTYFVSGLQCVRADIRAAFTCFRVKSAAKVTGL